MEKPDHTSKQHYSEKSISTFKGCMLILLFGSLSSLFCLLFWHMMFKNSRGIKLFFQEIKFVYYMDFLIFLLIVFSIIFAYLMIKSILNLAGPRNQTKE